MTRCGGLGGCLFIAALLVRRTSKRWLSKAGPRSSRGVFVPNCPVNKLLSYFLLLMRTKFISAVFSLHSLPIGLQPQFGELPRQQSGDSWSRHHYVDELGSAKLAPLNHYHHVYRSIFFKYAFNFYYLHHKHIQVNINLL